jgi:hypothetical protein
LIRGPDASLSGTAFAFETFAEFDSRGDRG